MWRQVLTKVPRHGSSCEFWGMAYALEDSNFLNKILAQLSSVLLSARSATSVAGTVVAEGQHILAGIIRATHDVSLHYDHSF